MKKNRQSILQENRADTLLKIIFRYIELIGNERNVEKLLVLLADMGRDLVSADRCTVWLIDQNSGKIWTKVAHGIERLEVPLSKGIVGYVAETGEHIVINNAYRDDRFDQGVDKITGYHTKNIIALPIKDSEGKIIGVYQAINKISGNKKFSKQDLEHLFLVTSYTGKQLEVLAYIEEIDFTKREIILTLAKVGEIRSQETGNHVKRVAEYSRLLAESYGLTPKQINLLKDASLMHDIGKVGIPDSILNKPGKLTSDERKAMQNHTKYGYDILRYSERDLMKAAAIVAYQHHEKWDGSGYPRGLKGEGIHIFGRIIATADVFDALMSKRVYKDAIPIEEILSLFEENRGKHFDPAILDAFLKVKDKMLEVSRKFADI